MSGFHAMSVSMRRDLTGVLNKPMPQFQSIRIVDECVLIRMSCARLIRQHGTHCSHAHVSFLGLGLCFQLSLSGACRTSTNQVHGT